MYIANHPTITTNKGLRPTYVEVDLGRLTDNYKAIQSKVGDVTVMPILKANAYGHGLVEVAKHMATLDVKQLGVAYLEEALLLREAAIQLPIFVLGGILDSQVPMFLEHDLTLAASSLEKLKQVDEAAEAMGKRAKVHLKIDTGMERIGVHYYSAESLLEASLKCKHVEIEGIFSHFANADAADLSSARLQIERFEEVLDFYERRSVPTPLRHMANSGAILQLPESYLDIVRPGILLFGVYPSHEVQQTVAVQPALSWKSTVVYFKVVKPGHPVSYGSTWESDHNVRVVTVPVGYGDGYFRSMSNKAEVMLSGKRYPVVGRVCMDQFMVNIEWDSAYNGDEVVLVGEMEGERITVEDLAAWAGTIPYEVLTNINTRVPRVYI
ncbi:MAG: alanine racemase [Chloroflexi bacterium]|nr:MAG: alanine racemase [Chloroflexota bacterium]MBL1193362.1 alanine racemase [Chloroflexota bacterium]NOH10654.1 alanine racemase [Chloroflexota bacterium]